jgi:hypothetical protein
MVVVDRSILSYCWDLKLYSMKHLVGSVQQVEQDKERRAHGLI